MQVPLENLYNINLYSACFSVFGSFSPRLSWICALSLSPTACLCLRFFRPSTATLSHSVSLSALPHFVSFSVCLSLFVRLLIKVTIIENVLKYSRIFRIFNQRWQLKACFCVIVENYFEFCYIYCFCEGSFNLGKYWCILRYTVGENLISERNK